MKTAAQLFEEARQRIEQVTPTQVQEALARKDELTLVDVREPNEWNLGHIPEAVHIPRGVLESAAERSIPRERRIVLYCQSGNRSALAVESLQAMGYASVASMSGGFRGWADMGGDIE